MIITRVLIKVLAREFYRLNAGFFLVIMGLAFGFMSGVEHKALAEFFISSKLLVCIPIALWLIYSVKVILFNTATLQKAENAFVRSIVHLSPVSTLISVTLVILLQLLPVHVYGVFLILTGIKNNLYTTLPTIMFALIVLHFISMLKFLRDVRITTRELNPSRFKVWMDKTFQRSFSFMVLEWLMRTSFLSWLGTKLFSCLLLLGIIQLYNIESYDYRLMAMGAAVAITSNILLLNHLHKFENHVLSFYRNLPLPFTYRFLNMFIPMVIICLPEMSLLASHSQHEWSFYFIIPMALTMLIGYYGLLYWKDWGIERSVQHAFFITLALIFLILVKVPLCILATTIATTGLILWKTNYYRFEYTRTDSP